jgi:hypothetical protein
MELHEIREKLKEMYGGENKPITAGHYDQSLAVKCINGTFVGRKTDNITVFRGIPYVAIVDSTVYIDQFPFPTAFKHILPYPFRHEIRDAKFLAYLPIQRLLWRLTIVDMTSYRRVPLPWLDILPLRPLLEIYLAP